MRRRNKEEKRKICSKYTPEQYEMIERVNGKLGSTVSEIQRNIVLLYLNKD